MKMRLRLAACAASALIGASLQADQFNSREYNTLSSFFDAGISSFTADTTLDTARWSTTSATEALTSLATPGAANLAIDSEDAEVRYTASSASADKLTEVDISLSTWTVTELPTAIPENAQALVCIYEQTDATNYVAYVKKNGTAGWVTLTGVPAVNSPIAMKVIFDYNVANAPKVAFKVRDTYLTSTDETPVTWFDTLLSTATCLSSASFTGTGTLTELKATQGNPCVASVTINDVTTNYETFDAAIAAAGTTGTIALLDDVTWSPSAAGTYNIAANGHTLTVIGRTAQVNDATVTIGGKSYHWIGGESGNWADGNNWSLSAGGTAAGAYPTSNTDDDAIVSTAASIAIADKSNVATLHLNADVTLTGTGRQIAVGSVVSGDGAAHKLSLSGVKLRGVGTASVDENTELVMVAGAPIQLISEQGKSFTLNGALSGSGDVTCTISGNSTNGGAIVFKGDTSAYSGHLTTETGNNARPWHRIDDAKAANNARSSWTFNQGSNYTPDTGSDYTQYFPLRLSNTTYTFGTLSGSIPKCKAKTKGWLTGVTLSVGARDEDCELNGDFYQVTETEFDWTAPKATIGYSVATTTRFKLLGGGTAVLTNSLPSQITFSFDGGVLKTDLDPSAKIVSSDATIVFDDEGENRAWSESLADSNTAGFTKRGGGTLTLKKVPYYTGTTTVEAGKLLFPAGSVVEKVDVKDGAAIGLYSTQAYTEATDVLTIKAVAEGQDLKTIFPDTTTISFEFVTDEESGVITVKATRAAATYTWTGAADSSWNNLGNWKIGTEDASELPIAVDTVKLPALEEGAAAWNLILENDVTIGSLVVNGAASLSGAAIFVAGQSVASELETLPVLTLGDDAALRATEEANAKITVDVPLNITASVGHTAKVAGRSSTKMGGATITVNKAVTGSGYLEVSGGRATIRINGSLSNFTGHFTIPKDGIDRLDVTIAEGPNALASWDIYGLNDNNDKKSPTFTWTGGKTYTFGSLVASLRLNTTQTNYLRQIYEIGSIEGSQNSLSGNLFAISAYINLIGSWTSTAANDNRGHTIRKVGNSSMTYSATHAKAIEINGGTFEITQDASYYNSWTENGETKTYNIKISFKGDGGTLVMPEAVTFDPSASFTGSTKPISIDTATAREWANEISSSNVGGFTKKGEGTLTLDVAPKYTGPTRIEGGELVVNGAINLENGSAVVIADPAAAMKAGTVYLQATSITGAAKLESTSEDASKYALRKVTENGVDKLKVVERKRSVLVIFN